MKNKVVYEAKINKKATNLVMDMLDELYDNPEAAVLREYVSNAYKANTDAKATKPIEVHLPEKKAPYLSIKDYGDGLNSTSIIAMFAEFGADAGNNDDKLIDSFKNGPKTAIAVSNNIEVTSVNNGVLNKLLLKHTKNTISARFLIKDEPTTEASGTNIVIDFKDKIDNFCIWFYGYKEFMTEKMLCGYSRNEVYVTNTELERLNKCRVPDAWYFNGYEYRKPTNNKAIPNFKGILIDKAFYLIPAQIYRITDYDESKSLVITLNKRDVKVTDSRENINVDNEITTVRVKEAIQYASVHAQKEYAAIADDTSLQPYEKIKRLNNIGINTSPIQLSLENQAAPIPKILDEPAMMVEIYADEIAYSFKMDIEPYPIEIDTQAFLFLVFDEKLPSKTALRKFIKWLLDSNNSAFNKAKGKILSNTWTSTIVTTKNGYAKLYFTDNIDCANMQLAYDVFKKASK
jgi:hypothetical protein